MSPTSTRNTGFSKTSKADEQCIFAVEDPWGNVGDVQYSTISGSQSGVIYIFFDHLPKGISPYLKDQWRNIFEIMDVPPNYQVWIIPSMIFTFHMRHMICLARPRFRNDQSFFILGRFHYQNGFTAPNWTLGCPYWLCGLFKTRCLYWWRCLWCKHARNPNFWWLHRWSKNAIKS